MLLRTTSFFGSWSSPLEFGVEGGRLSAQSHFFLVASELTVPHGGCENTVPILILYGVLVSIGIILSRTKFPYFGNLDRLRDILGGGRIAPKNMKGLRMLDPKGDTHPQRHTAARSGLW